MDTIGDMIIRIKNAGMAKKPSVVVPASKLRLAVAEKLKERGFVGAIEKHGKKIKRSIELQVLYHEDGTPKVSDVKRVSKPGRRLYVKNAQCTPVYSGRGVAIISTSQGVLTGEEAKKAGVGGEILFTLW
jgi:small subunit ribosomal protein S8